MSQSTATSTGKDCALDVNPADQPHLPKKGDCKEPTNLKVPELKAPPECRKTDCTCPPGPTSKPSCLEDLIREQGRAAAAADKAKTIKADLEALLGKAKAAGQEYTPDKYKKLVKQWIQQDEEIAELIRKLVCAVPCWRCIVECYVCPILDELRKAEYRLNGGDDTLYTDVNNLYDLQYWSARNKDIKQRAFDRVKSVLAAWEKPAQSIDKALADDAKLIADANKALGTDAPKVVYDVFLKLVPMHLAIAPPAGATIDNKSTTTMIDKRFTEFCDCDEEPSEDCCGADVGPWTLRQRLTGPQAYLVDPNYYLELICCLVEKHYGPANKALNEADGQLITVDSEIKALKAQLDEGLKSFEKNAKAAIPSDVVCCDQAIKIPREPSSSEAS